MYQSATQLPDHSIIKINNRSTKNIGYHFTATVTVTATTTISYASLKFLGLTRLRNNKGLRHLHNTANILPPRVQQHQYCRSGLKHDQQTGYLLFQSCHQLCGLQQPQRSLANSNPYESRHVKKHGQGTVVCYQRKL